MPPRPRVRSISYRPATAVESTADRAASSAASSARLYWESFRNFSTDYQVTVPAGCSIFPKEIFRSSRRWAEKRFTKLVEDAQAAGWRSSQDARTLAASLWAALHGLAELWLWGGLAEKHLPATLDATLNAYLG